MKYWAVSDVAPPKLERFAQLLRESSRQRVSCATNAQVQKNWFTRNQPPQVPGRVSLGVDTKKRFPIGMRVYDLRLTRLHSSVEANRHRRGAALVLHLLFAER
jgi:hypothetical protein